MNFDACGRASSLSMVGLLRGRRRGGRLAPQAAHPLADHLDGRLRRSRCSATPCPCAMTTRRSQISNSSSSSSLTTSTAQPSSRSASSSPRICAAAPTSTPQVGCETISSFGFASISRPTMNFCRLPPESDLAAAPGPPALTLKRLIRSTASAAARRQCGSSRRCDRAGARQQRVLRERQRRHGAAAQALLGHEVQAGVAPLARRLARDVLAEQRDRAPGRTRVLARERRHQLLLAVARDAGDADDLAGAHVEADVGAASCRTDRPWRMLRPLTPSTVSPRLRLDVLQLRRLGADHQPRQAGVGLGARIDLAGDLAAAQHRAVVAQRADLVELVADVEDRAALAAPACAA